MTHGHEKMYLEKNQKPEISNKDTVDDFSVKAEVLKIGQECL